MNNHQSMYQVQKKVSERKWVILMGKKRSNRVTSHRIFEMEQWFPKNLNTPLPGRDEWADCNKGN